jgi:hypothetical protein
VLDRRDRFPNVLGRRERSENVLGRRDRFRGEINIEKVQGDAGRPACAGGGGFFLKLPCIYPSTQREIESIDIKKSNHERKTFEGLCRVSMTPWA